MSCFTTGVTVVTTRHQSQDWGMTCNSFNTVSLEPALVLWSIRKSSVSHDAFLQGGGYLVNVLSAEQKDLALRFASGTQAQRFEGLEIQRSLSTQRARLPHAVAWFDCAIEQVVSAGDHDILIGRVQDFGVTPGPALAYAHRQFGSLAPLED